MRFPSHRTAFFALAILLACAPESCLAQIKRDKTVWNYDGGILLVTDGSFPNGTCFRVAGRVTAPQFFDNLKRIDTSHGAEFRRGTEIVTNFPSELFLSYEIHDFPCTPGLQQVGTQVPLTREMVSTLQLSLYWKHGVELRPVGKITEVNSSISTVTPYATELASELPQRFQWSYDLLIPSDGVPLTDSLVLVFRLPDAHIAARVAARM